MRISRKIIQKLYRQGSFSRVTLAGLVAVMLACSLTETGGHSTSNRLTILTRLPTLTLTPLPAMTPVAHSSSSLVTPFTESAAPTATSYPSSPNTIPAPAATLAPLPTSAAPSPAVLATAQAIVAATSPAISTPIASPVNQLPTATPILEVPGWTVANVQLYPDQLQAGLRLYGDVINNTGVSQELTAITGAFYDAQGQLLADEDDLITVWPIEVIPAGGRLPFELAIPGLQSAADFELKVQAQPNSQIPHQNFGFPEINEFREDDSYCLIGKVQNLGAQLHDYLMVMAVLYDGQDRIINFSEDYEPDPLEELVDFEICIDLLKPDVARYELRAWGE